MTTTQLPAGSMIEVLDEADDRLCIGFPAASASPVRLAASLIAIPFWILSLIGTVLLAVRILQGSFGMSTIFEFLCLGALCMVSVVLFAVALFSCFGRTMIALSQTLLECRWSAGRLAFSMSIPTPLIESVRVETFEFVRGNPRVRQIRLMRESLHGTAALPKVCVARARGRSIWLTVGHDELLSRQVAALLRTKLESVRQADRTG